MAKYDTKGAFGIEDEVTRDMAMHGYWDIDPFFESGIKISIMYVWLDGWNESFFGWME